MEKLRFSVFPHCPIILSHLPLLNLTLSLSGLATWPASRLKVAAFLCRAHGITDNQNRPFKLSVKLSLHYAGTLRTRPANIAEIKYNFRYLQKLLSQVRDPGRHVLACLSPTLHFWDTLEWCRCHRAGGGGEGLGGCPVTAEQSRPARPSAGR